VLASDGGAAQSKLGVGEGDLYFSSVKVKAPKGAASFGETRGVVGSVSDGE
jgi:hypothetical protein